MLCLHCHGQKQNNLPPPPAVPKLLCSSCCWNLHLLPRVKHISSSVSANKFYCSKLIRDIYSSGHCKRSLLKSKFRCKQTWILSVCGVCVLAHKCLTHVMGGLAIAEERKWGVQGQNTAWAWTSVQDLNLIYAQAGQKKKKRLNGLFYQNDSWNVEWLLRQSVSPQLFKEGTVCSFEFFKMNSVLWTVHIL